MAKAKQEKVDFSKFFPADCYYVSVNGKAKGSDHYDAELNIGDGNSRVTFALSDFFGKDSSMNMLKAVQDGIQKMMEFHQKVMKMPPADRSRFSAYEHLKDLADKSKPAGYKPAAKKKPASSKKVVK